MRMRNKKSGFSLLEIMIVVTIIGFLAGLAVPAFMKARAATQKGRCIDNMRQMAGAKEQWAVENFGNNGDTIPDGVLEPFFKRGMPACPAGGVYEVNVVGDDPTCNLSTLGHTI
jgi:prepilin-type N-terminal cleavage/methylation domain-containing protein